MINYYKFLDLPETIPHEEMVYAFEHFKAQLKKFSPGIEISDEELRLRKPNEWDAYAILINPISRKEHDEWLERERIHKLDEERNRIKEQKQDDQSSRLKYLGLGATLLVFMIYFVFQQIAENTLPVQPKWQSHYINKDMKILLPVKVDTVTNILPPYLINYIQKAISFKSELPNGFCVTLAVIDMNEDFRVSLKDLKYITSLEAQNPHMRAISHSGEELNGSYKGYKMVLDRETYQIDNVVRACENYTFLKGLTAIKLIVNYNPGDPLQEKYNEIVFKSIN